ncbi:MAG: hypothetical protein HYX69_12860 [Planctomycetia bacterium]|nr:hypothetical protein [Planctomycetia bacterium]
MPTSTPHVRRLFQFGLRNLLVGMTALAVWLAIQVNWIKNRHDAVSWIAAQAEVWRDLPVSQRAYPGRDAPWRIRMLGEMGVEQISVVVEKDIVATKQRELERLFPEADVLVLTPGPGYTPK